MLSYEMQPCKDCNGEGTVYVMLYCGRSIDNCCGGCTRDERCETCNGTGQVEPDDIYTKD